MTFQTREEKIDNWINGAGVNGKQLHTLYQTEFQIS